VGLISAYYKIKEYLKIYKFRLTEEATRHKIFLELVTLRWKSLFSVALLIIISFIIDVIFSQTLAPIIANQSWYNILKIYLQFPSIGIVTSLLSAVISGVAAIIGLLLSISLVVLELAANRYPYRMIRFLVEEKVGAYIIDFLIITFVFSLWTLFLLQRGVIIPYISVFVSLLLASLSIVFVFVYRDYGLYFFRPQQGFRAVSLEAKKPIFTVFKKGKKLGKSVTDYLQRKVQESIQVMTDFTEVLVNKKDPESSYGVVALSSVLSFYTTGKRFIDIQSGWFPFVEVPVSSQKDLASLELSRPFEELALGTRTERKPNIEWLEKQILRSLRAAQIEAVQNNDKACLSSLIYGFKDIVENCFQQQEFQILDLVISELHDFGIQISTLDCPEALSEFYNTMLLLTEKSIRGLNLQEMRETLKKLSWSSEEEVSSFKLPKIFNEQLLSYQRKLETEIVIDGKIITPAPWIEKEIIEGISKIDKELSRKYYAETFRILSKVYAKVRSENLPNEIRNVIVAELLPLRRALVLNRKELALEHIDNVMKNVLDAYESLKEKKDLRYDIFKELKLGCLNSLNRRENQTLDKFFETLVLVSINELKEDEDSFPEEAFESLMIIASLAFLDSEFYQDDRPFDMVAAKFLQYFDVNKLTKSFDTLLSRYDPKLTLKYHHWFKDIFLKISKIPVITKERPPSRVPDIVPDHPSEFIQRSHHLIGIEECAKGMAKKMKEMAKSRSKSMNQR